MPGIETILHPTDFSESSRYAFQTACALARDNKATLIVLHVLKPNVSSLARAGTLAWEEDGTMPVVLPAVAPPRHGPPPDLDNLESPAALPWPTPSDAQIRVEYRLAEGDPAEEILRLTAVLRCDLIVMGTHGRTGLGRVLAGSVAEAVLRRAVGPVMVLKTPSRATPGMEPEPTAKPGDVVDVRPLESGLDSAQTGTLLRSSALEIVRLIVRAGQEIQVPPRSQGEIIMHCLEGRVTLTALGKLQVLTAGTLVDLPAGEPHVLNGTDDASLLLTILAPRP